MTQDQPDGQQAAPTGETIDVAGQPVPVRFQVDGREISADEWNLTYSTNGTTLRAACQGEGLPYSGTNAAKAKRLIAAGLTRDEVEAKYGWRARRAAQQS